MLKRIFLASVFILTSILNSFAQDTLWIKYDDRFTANKADYIGNCDSIVFKRGLMYLHRTPGEKVKKVSKQYVLNGEYTFENPGRWLYKPSYWSNNNFSNSASRWCFERSMESEHFVVFWEPGFGLDPTKATGGYAFNPAKLLRDGERYYEVYANELGFLKVGESTTDKVKIMMFVYYQEDWKAEGSGYDHKVGSFNVNPWAISSREGVTVAHEIAHTFQYLVKCDLGEPHGFDYGYGDGATGGNGWWESCANWQAYKAYPNLQFVHDEYFNAHLDQHHLNMLHEGWRYQNCFMQDWWCMKHGMDFIGRLWREARRPEYPIEAYMRLNNLTLEQFNEEMYEGFARMATWDIDHIREKAKHRLGQHRNRLVATTVNGDADWWEVDKNFCPQNYGYNINRIKTAPAGTVIKAQFKGNAGATGYRKINLDKAGWRYGFVALTKDGERIYSPVQSDPNGTAEITVPENVDKMWFVVMGAPTEYWRHPWDDNESNDEQWPYLVKFENTAPYGTFKNYDEYPEDYVRKDTTVVLEADLALSNTYSSVRVQFDMDAISQALGLSTKQMQSVKVGTSNKIRFAAVGANGNITNNNTITNASSTLYGHWFNISGNVCGYDSNARIFTEFYPDKYGCYVGQYPNKLTRGRTYTVREAIIYKHTDGKEYKAIMEIHLHII